MFRPFQRLDDIPQTTGVGLGLAVAKGFTEAMGGTLTAEQTPGGGLTMVIRLPLSTGIPAEDQHNEQAQLPVSPSFSGQTAAGDAPATVRNGSPAMTGILVVDDDPHLL